MNALHNLEHKELMAVIQLGYQLIISANYGSMEDDDEPSIDLVMSHLGYTPNNSNLVWLVGINTNPFEAFDIVSQFSDEKKRAFKAMILDVSNLKKTMLRLDIASQIFSRVGIQ